MIIYTAVAALHNKYEKKKDKNKLNKMEDINKLTPGSIFLKILETIMWIIGGYFYYNCHYAKGVVSSNSDKMLGLWGWCCCLPCYILYHLVRPC